MKFGRDNIGILKQVIWIILSGVMITVAASCISGPWLLGSSGSSG